MNSNSLITRLKAIHTYMMNRHKYLMHDTIVYDMAPYAMCAIVLLCLAVFLP